MMLSSVGHPAQIEKVFEKALEFGVGGLPRGIEVIGNVHDALQVELDLGLRARGARERAPHGRRRQCAARDA